MSQQEIPKEIFEAHRQLSGCSAKFIEFVKDNPEASKRANFESIVAHPIFNRYPQQPWPTFINEKTKNAMEEACLQVFNLVKSIPGRVFDYDPHKIGRYYEIPVDKTRQLLEGVDDDYLGGLISRGDFIISPAAGLKCIEYNMRASLGGWQQDFMEDIYTSIPVIRRFIKEYSVKLRKSHFFLTLLEPIMDRAVERFGPNPKGEINTAIVFKEYLGDGQGFLNIRLKEMYKTALWKKDPGLKGDMFFCDFDKLQVVNNSIIFRGKKIHVMIERCFGEVPGWVLEVVKSGNLLLYNGPIVQIMANKFNIALLSELENSDLFSLEEKENIKKYIPWTRKLIPGETTYGTKKIRLEDFVISHQERLMVKSARGYGGYEVFDGARIPAGQWKQQVEKALEERLWVVQEFIPPYSYLYQAGEHGCVPYQVVWGIFVFGSRYAGGFVRVLPEQNPSRVINLNQKAEQSVALLVEE
ncbi:MAG: hypothetical protein JSV88_33675 [Candidatus Aminicenantes bacterium]|nr:MAG: hypothetical protein JSV88_33675 [Candidatus Aminicenantes bacterium]